jgi:hypothetical protein
VSPNLFRRNNQPAAEPVGDRTAPPLTQAKTPTEQTERAGALCTPPGGGEHNAHVPAPAGAGSAPAHEAGSEAEAGVEAERGLHQDQPTAADVVRLAPTVSADEFVHRGTAAEDLPALEHDDSTPTAKKRRHLSRVRNRQGGGDKLAERLNCSASPAEKEFIDAVAQRLDVTRSSFLMNAALAYAHALEPELRPAGVLPLPSPQAVQDLMVLHGKVLRHFGRIGQNLNQITYTIHTGEIPERAAFVLDELHHAVRSARAAMDRVLAGGDRRGA